MSLVVAVACAGAASSGFFLTVSALQGRELRKQRKDAKAMIGGLRNAESPAGSVFQGRSPALELLQRASRSSGPAWVRPIASWRLWDIGISNPSTLLARAGVLESATPEGIRMARIQCSITGMGAGAVAGAVFTPELSLLLAGLGAVGGYAAVPLALRRRAAERTADMERRLSEMVEVVVLGLRSGLSFERSFRLYPEYFDTELSRSMSRVARQWEIGLTSREDALRALEGEYDSTLLSRVVGSMVRSLRFGTSIADSLESTAMEARESHRARMEERVAKVAVKMMLPVGTLILPAMLLLVLGPVLLELVQGF